MHAAFDFWGDQFVPLGDKKLAENRSYFSELASYISNLQTVYPQKLGQWVSRPQCALIHANKSLCSSLT